MYRPQVEESPPSTTHNVCGNWTLLVTTISLLFLSVLIWLVLVQAIMTQHFHHEAEQRESIHFPSTYRDQEPPIFPPIFQLPTLPPNNEHIFKNSLETKDDYSLLESSVNFTSSTAEAPRATTFILTEAITAQPEILTTTEAIQPHIHHSTEAIIPQEPIVDIPPQPDVHEQSVPEVWCHLYRGDYLSNNHLTQLSSYCTHVVLDDELVFLTNLVVFDEGDLERYRRFMPNARLILGTKPLTEFPSFQEDLIRSLLNILKRTGVHGVAVHDMNATGSLSVVTAKFFDFYMSLAKQLHLHNFIHTLMLRHNISRYKENNLTRLMDDTYSPLVIFSHSLFPPSNSLCTSPFKWRNRRVMTQSRVLREVRDYFGKANWKKHIMFTMSPFVTSCIVRNASVLSRCKTRQYSQFCAEVHKGNLIPNTTQYGNETNCFSAQTRQDANSPLYLWTGSGPYSMNFVQNLISSRGVLFFNVTGDDRDAHCDSQSFGILSNMHAVLKDHRPTL